MKDRVNIEVDFIVFQHDLEKQWADFSTSKARELLEVISRFDDQPIVRSLASLVLDEIDYRKMLAIINNDGNVTDR